MKLGAQHRDTRSTVTNGSSFDPTQYQATMATAYPATDEYKPVRETNPQKPVAAAVAVTCSSCA